MKLCSDITLKDAIISVMMTVITIKHPLQSCTALLHLLADAGYSDQPAVTYMMSDFILRCEVCQPSFLWLALTQESQHLISGQLLKINGYYFLLWSKEIGNHCSACVISPQMNQDNGRAKWERRQFRLQRGNALSNRSACCDISVFNLPAVSIWMVSAHDFAHRAAVENCSSHSSDLSPAAKEIKLLKGCLYWAVSSFCSVRGAFRPKWIACSCKGIQEQLGRKRATPGMQGEWHLLGTWGTTSLYVI